MLNRGKKGVTLDVRTEKGREICKELAKKADIVVENFTPGVMDGFGLGYEDLKKINPEIIYASISGFGHTGPRRDFPAFDLIAQAMGGFMSVTGFPHDPPTKAGMALADYLGGLYATIGILAALQHRMETGEGQFVDISLQDCVWAITAVGNAPSYF
jgi:Predicted acyl-CoA transferases/carnitine dehydratase